MLSEWLRKSVRKRTDAQRGRRQTPRHHRQVDPVAIDDFAHSLLGSRARNRPLDLLDDGVGGSSILIASQTPLARWHDYLGDPTLADAILDRL